MGSALTGAVRAADESPNVEATPAAQLEKAWWRATEMIGNDEPWRDAAEQLNDALIIAGGTKMERRCARVAVSIGLAESAAPAVESVTRTLNEDSSIDDMITALQESRISYDLVLRPLQSYGINDELMWDYIKARGAGGREAAPYMLYARGREAIPKLLDALADQRATRSVAANRNRRVPLILRVGDISLAIIEGISMCRFHMEPVKYHVTSTQTPLISEWNEKRRNEQIALVRTWWETTKNMSPTEAALWRAERASRDEQLQMMYALIACNEHDAALGFLSTRYRQGDELDLDFARCYLRTGSREPLEFLRQATLEGRVIDHDLIRLISDFGEIDDFKLLREALNRPCVESYAIERTQVVNELSSCNNPLVIPVLITILETQDSAVICQPNLAYAQRDSIPTHLLRACERIEALSGKDFGFTRHRSAYAASRGIEDILNWWRREGKAAYDLEQIRPYAPGGIR